jgi:hypothetical protein
MNRFRKFVASTALAIAIGSGGAIAFAPSAQAAGSVPAELHTKLRSNS